MIYENTRVYYNTILFTSLINNVIEIKNIECVWQKNVTMKRIWKIISRSLHLKFYYYYYVSYLFYYYNYSAIT